MKKTVIYHLSALPGSGKTRLMIKKMKEHLIKRSPGIIIYVSPTIVLLNQVKEDLERSFKGDSSGRIYQIVSSNLGIETTSIATRLTSLLTGKANSRDKEPWGKIASGSVILMTHAGFLTLPDNLPRKDELTLIFDEARKFTSEFPRLVMSNPKERRLFAKLVEDNSTPLKSKDGKATKFRHLTLQSWPGNLNRISNSSSSKLQYPLLREIVTAARNPRLNLYYSVHDKNSKVSVYNFYEVIVPAKFFAGFACVILVAAFLETSQMWHLLKTCQSSDTKVQLKSIWKNPEYSKYQNWFTKSTQDIKTRLSKLCIFPLTEQRTPLSMRRLDEGVIVPMDEVTELKHGLEDLGLSGTGDLIEFFHDRSKRPGSEKNRKALALLDKHTAHLDVFSWYVKEAINFVEILKTEKKVVGDVLSVVNNKKLSQVKREHSFLRGIPVISNGLNSLKEHNTMVFIAALNPRPTLIRLYKALLPDYSFVLDHMADSAAQAVTRLCLRDVDSELVTYVIVPDTAMAEILKNKLLDLPLISRRALDRLSMTALHTLNPSRKRKLLSPEEAKKAARTRHSRWRKQNRDKLRLVNRRNYLRKKLAVNPKDEETLRNLRQTEKELKYLTVSKDDQS